MARHSYALDLRQSRWWRARRGEKPYGLGGACASCARCCEAPAIQVGRLVWLAPSLRRAFLWWQRAVNGFVLVERDARARAFVFRCTHFDLETRRCDSYESRPGMCRDYPRALLWQPAPELFAECGYRALSPNAAGLRRALERESLSPEQRAKLRRGLYLGDDPPNPGG